MSARPGSAATGAAPDGAASGAILELADIRHSYDGVLALRGVSLDVRRGEFLTLLGPSGSGKSTLLRVIAGLESPDSTRVMRLDGKDIRGLPANLRNVSTVFQHYALFPHMSVGANVEYSLKVRGVAPEVRRQRAEEALALVRLPGKYERRIHQLSGGERQRVALARSLVMEPAVLLLDEPLGALDERLRLEMQAELIELRRRTGGTFILVTHSQEEAITMSDRIVLMRAGGIEQVGTPRELFASPATEFAARFMGVENILSGTLDHLGEGTARIRVGDTVLAGRPVGDGADLRPGAPVFAAFRAEHLRPGAEPSANTLKGEPRPGLYKGRFQDVPFATPVGELVARLAEEPVSLPPEVQLSVAPEHCLIGALDQDARP